MGTKTIDNPSILNEKSTKQTMVELTIALSVLFIVVMAKMFMVDTQLGLRTIILMASSVSAAWLVEIIWFFFMEKKAATAAKEETTFKPVLCKAVKKTLKSFPWITAMILVLSLTVTTSIYAVVMGTIVGIVVGKLLYGGFGFNIFNPAGVGRAIIVVGIAVTSAEWVGEIIGANGVAGGTEIVSGGWLPGHDGGLENLGNLTWDAITDLWIGFSDNFGSLFKYGAMGETYTLLILALGVALAIRRILDWRVVVSYLGSFAIFVYVSALMHIDGANAETAAMFTMAQLAIGGLMFGAVFMATDPVTMPNHPAARVIFGIGLAFFTALIRFAPGLPEGVLFAILMMNMLSPLIGRIFTGKAQNRKDIQLIAVSSAFVASLLIVMLATGSYWG